MNFVQVDGSEVLKLMKKQGLPNRDVAVFETVSRIRVIHSIDETEHGRLRHVSISHPARYPTWDEIKEAKYHFFKKDEDAVMIFPRAEGGPRYINFHQNCFHLWELPKIPGRSGKWELE